QTYRAAEETCRYGDPLLGFKQALELPTVPDGAPAATPDTADLLGQLASKIGDEAKRLDLPVDASRDLLAEEERLLDTLHDFVELMKQQPLPPEAHSFQFRIQELYEEVRSRRDKRADQREKLLAKEKEKEQDILLATARAHDQAGDLGRALAAY